MATLIPTGSNLRNILNLQGEVITVNDGNLNIGKLTSINLQSGRMYTPFYSSNDVQSNISQTITEATWSGGDGTLTSFYTQSAQPSIEYYVDVYNADPQLDDTSEQQFSIAYGHYDGKGSTQINNEGNDATLTSTKSNYFQYRNVIINDDSEKFSFNGVSSDHVMVINFYRARLKEMIDPGNWELTITTSSGSFTFVDDLTLSVDNTTRTTTRGSYYIVSGSIADGTYLDGSGLPVVYGISYYAKGLLVFNGDALLDNAGLDIVQSVDTANNNHITMFDAIGSGASFKSRNSQRIKSTYYFVRVKNSEYNFSNNPTFVTGSLGDIRHTEMIRNPSVYITTVGLYNDRNELLGVAKLSQPILKNFYTETLIRVKLDY